MLRKILRVSVFVLLFLVIAAFAAPLLFKKQILAFVKKEINNNIAAQVAFSDLDISFFRRFPRVAVAIEDVQVTGAGDFAGDTLLQAKRLDAAVNMMSLFKGSDYVVYAVTAESPRIYAHMLQDGRANWDIALPDTSTSIDTTAAAPYTLQLKNYTIRNASIRYHDESLNLDTELQGLNHNGSGDFTSDKFLLQTNTVADKIFLRYGGIPYLAGVAARVDAGFDIDNKNGTYTFRQGNIRLNDLLLSAEGSFRSLNDSSYGMDISFKTTATDFKNLLSLIPALYAKDFASIKASGMATVGGYVKGVYSPTQMPGYNIDVEVRDGAFQYADLPQKVQQVHVEMHVHNPDGIPDHTVVRIPRAHASVDGTPIDAHLELRRPVSDPLIDAGVKGRMNLAAVQQWVKLEKGTVLRGLVNADVTIQGALSAIENGRYGQFHTAGTVHVKDLFYAAREQPAGFELKALYAQFQPQQIDITQLEGRYDATHFSGKGKIMNLLSYILHNGELRGALAVKADKLDLDTYLATGSGEAASSGTTATPLPFQVPQHVRMELQTEIGAVHYNKVDLHHITGSVGVADETISMKDLRAKALEGQVLVNGTYSTRTDKVHPDISLQYDVQGLDVQKTFAAFNTVQRLMPVGKFIDGKLNSKLALTGKLGSDMMPDFNSLTGSGNLLLVEGFLRKFAPVEELGKMLQVSELQSITLKDVKNYISFANGRMDVKPFKLNVKDINMEIGGNHGFDQSLNYKIHMKVPRKLMGAGGNQFVSSLEAKAAGRGFPLAAGEFVNLDVDLGGFILKPTIKTDLKGSGTALVAGIKTQITDMAKARVDSSRKIIKDSARALKKEVVQAAKENIIRQVIPVNDTTKTATPEDLRKKAERAGKGVLKGLLKKPGG